VKRPWLRPLVPLYAVGTALRWAGVTPMRLAWPVISIGNLSTGGTGKTPFTIALARLLLDEGMHVDVLSRGYGRRGTEAERVNLAGSAERFGDEPLLIARATGTPVYVGAQRRLAGELAEREAGSKAGVHLLDDGFQHRQLARAVDIVLVNSEDLADSLLPAGNLREGLRALKRASVLAVVEGDDPTIKRLNQLGFGAKLGQPVWRYRRDVVVPHIPKAIRSQRVVAFCGIARPEQFFAGLTREGFNVAASRAFPDHHFFTPAEMAMLHKLAESTGAGSLLTTAKDLVRLREQATKPDLATPIFVVDLDVVLEDEVGIAAWLRGTLGVRAKASS
jgi:tetraacyldisaccharide 4'-kinase